MTSHYAFGVLLAALTPGTFSSARGYKESGERVYERIRRI